MAAEALSTYLNDHVAGSVVAIGLMEDLESSYEGTEIATIVAGVRAEVLADRDTLVDLIRRVSGSASAPRKAAGWLAERVTELKLRADDGAKGPLRLLESTEIISLGIEGKRGLWIALGTAVDMIPVFAGIDFAGLSARAAAQRERIETVRLGAARAVAGTA